MERKILCLLSIGALYILFIHLVDGEPGYQPTILAENFSAMLSEHAEVANVKEVPLERHDAISIPEDRPEKSAQEQWTSMEKTPSLAVPEVPKHLRIAVFLWRGETAAERSFYQKLKELGYDVTYDIFDVHQNLKEVFQILDNKFNAKQYHYVYAFGSQLALILKRHLCNEIPLIFNAVSFPEETGLVVGLKRTRENITGSMLNITGGNTSGTSIVSDIHIQLEHAKILFPFERLCVWICPQELSSTESLRQIEDLKTEFQLQVFSYRIPNADALRNALDLLQEERFPIKCDAIWIPSGSLFVEKADWLERALLKSKIPVIAESQSLLQHGALISTAPDYAQTGIRLAEIVDQNQKGRDLQFIPVKCPEPRVSVDKTMLRKFSISIADKPVDFLKKIHYVQMDSHPEAIESRPDSFVDIVAFPDQAQGA
jgi:ABC-type uncharacterized transport system substrate-binding protein